MKKILFIISFFGLISCSGRVERLPNSFLSLSQQEPALSANGEKLALIVDQNGKPTVQLRDVRSGRIVSLRVLNRFQPHSSPSLSWNARYLAVIAQRGTKRVVMIEDRLTGRNYQIFIPGNRTPIRISLAPDASQIALQLVDEGKWRIELFDLKQTLELDIPRGFQSNISTELGI